MGRFDSPGCRAILRSLDPEASRQPVSTGVPCWSRTMTSSRVKVIVQSASQSGPTPIKVWWKPVMSCPLIGNPEGIWGKSKSPVPVYCWVFPVAVPTLTFGDKRSMLTIGESVEKYMSVSPESTMPVDFLSGLLGIVSVDMSRVGLKLA